MRGTKWLITLSFLSGCATSPLTQTQPSPLDETKMANAFARIKQEVGLFLSDGAAVHRKWPALLTDLGENGVPLRPVCGTGEIGFTINSIKMEFAGTVDNTIKGQVGLKIPIGATGITLSPGVTPSREIQGGVTVDYDYYPPTTGPETTEFDSIRDTSVIARALDSLRDALVRATTQKPCFENTPTKGGKDDSIKFSVEIVSDTSSSLGVAFLILSATATAEQKDSNASTITVSFSPTVFGTEPKK